MLAPQSFTSSPECRCVVCGCPMVDHIPIRYVIRAWLLHVLPAGIARRFRRRR